MKSNSVLVVDNDVEFLTFALDFLSVEVKFNQVVSAGTSEDAERKIRTFHPDIVILDLGMQGSVKISSLIKNIPETPVLVMTSYYENNDYINLVTKMGANGFFLKDEVKTALPKLIGFFKSDFYDLLRNNLYIMN
ncbi:MAG: response regulator [Ignavibacteriaceae bacterium]|nr:response regulator [Ignavibacteriaceae bacterium]